MSAILAIGESGVGKSAAMENLDPATTVIITPNNKQLPFPGAAAKYSKARNNLFLLQTFKAVGETIDLINKAPNIKTLILEDFTHYMSKDVMDRAADKGYEKWTELAVKIYNQMILKITTQLRPDLDAILIAHVSTTSDAAGNMEIGLQTAGKLLDNSIKIPSYFTYVFHGVINFEGDEPRYWFQTNRDNVRLAKTPKQCFPLYIPNDYKAILDRIHAYEQGKLDQCIIEPANK